MICLSIGTASLKAQSDADADSTGLPGDNFSLAGALELFKKAGSPEEFEKMLNTESNNVNNLDLNNDGDIDYVRVINKKDGDVQVFVLQVPVSASESQDIAVIELEKTGAESAVLQIVGDEDMYGEETILEPDEATPPAASVYTSSLHGPAAPTNEYNTFNPQSGIIVNVWMWPAVRFVYAPAYVVWVSPWGWGRRPVWFRPWRPLAWHAFRPYRYRYPTHYVVVHQHRIVRARPIYRPVRVTSVTVTNRNRAAVTSYRTTKKTRTVTTGNGRRVQATRRTTTVEGPRGNTATRTTTKVRRKRH
jgi:hypothetical protein